MSTAITQKQIDICNSPIQNKKIRLEVLDNYFKVVSTIEGDAVGGTINIDANNDCRRTCSLEIAIPNTYDGTIFVPDETYKIQYGGKVWIDRNIKIWIGIENLLVEGDYEWFNMGIFLIDEPVETFGADTNNISFNGIDIIKRLDSTRGGQLASLTTTIPQYQDANYTTRTTLRGAVAYVLEDLAAIYDYSISDEIDNAIWKYLPYDISVSAGATVYDLLVKLRDIPSNWEMYFDENGTFIFQPIPSGAEQTTVPITAAITTQDSVNIDFNNVKNQIIVYGGVQQTVKYTDTITYTSSSNRINLYFDSFGWGEFNIGSKIGFKNLTEYNTFTITKVSIYVGTTAVATNIPLVGSEESTPNVPALFLEPDEIYILRILKGDVDGSGQIIGTNVTFDLYTRQQPRYTAVEDNIDSEFYVNKYVRTPNYYGGQSQSNGLIYKITINDEDDPISSLPDNTYLTFMPNIITGSYNWRANISPISDSVLTNSFTSIAYGNNMYLATLATAAYKSTDGGNTWTQITDITISNSKAIFWNGSTDYFIIAGNSTLYVSTDLTSWTNLSSGYSYPSGRDPSQLNISEDNYSVIIGFKTGNQLFRLTNFSSTLSGYIITLPDGETTPVGTFGIFSSYTTGYACDTTGQVYLVALAQSETPSFLYRFYPNSNPYIGFYSNGYLYNEFKSFGTRGTSPKIIYANNLWVCVDYYANSIFTSTDGLNWTKRATTFSENPNAIVYGNNNFIIGGKYGKLSTSPDCVIWTQRTSSFGTTAINKIEYNGSMFVAVGDAGKIGISDDGYIWTQVSSVFGTTAINDVFFGNNLWVAVGASGKLATSADGIIWTLQTSSFGTTGIYTVTYNDGLFVAGGASGKVATSTDGTTWTQITTGISSSYSIRAAFYGNGQFILGADSKLYSSIDGTTWAQIPPTTLHSTIGSIFYANGLLVLSSGGIIVTVYPKIFALFSSSELFVTQNVEINGLWTTVSTTLSPTYRGGISYNHQLYIYGTDSSLGQFVTASQDMEWYDFLDVSKTFYNNNVVKLYTDCLSIGSDKLIGIFSISSGGIGYFTRQISSTSDIVYELFVYSSSDSVNPLAIGNIVTQSLINLPYGKFTNDYSIQIVKWDAANERFIYQGVLNSYLQVDTGGDFENIPTDDLCRQRADYELYLHSNTNDSITLPIIPNYYLNVHNRISYANTYKDPLAEPVNYLIKTMTIPVTDDNTMTITAIRLYSE